MIPYLSDPDLTLYNGDALEVLRELPAESVQMCVTSPPYWGLRDYSCEGQLGLEPTPELYIERMAEVFREVKRVLRADGTCWLNIGDSYSSGFGEKGQLNERWGNAVGQRKQEHERPPAPVTGLAPKNLCMIPARLALALQADGWWLRSQIVWSKPNPMPESVSDRPTSAYELVYLLAKQPHYYFDAEAVREQNVKVGSEGHLRSGNGNRHPNHAGLAGKVVGSSSGPPESGNGLDRLPDPLERGAGEAQERQRDFERHGRQVGHHGRVTNESGRNLRNVWTIATEPFPEAHFATFPQALVERCIKAGTSERGCCPECGTGWVREVEAPAAEPARERWGADASVKRNDKARAGGFYPTVTTIGWRPSCECGDDDPFRPEHTTPCTVLDPFMGSGTTALVARRLGRRCIGIELSPDYCELSADRTKQLSLEASA